MISEYLEKEVVLVQLKHEVPYNNSIDWDWVLEHGRRIGDYIAYPIKSEGAWLLTNYWTGCVEDVAFEETFDDIVRGGYV